MVSISRMWVLQSQGQDCRKKSSTPKTRVEGSLEDFLSQKKAELKSKENEEDRSLGPQHAELLVRLFKLCSEEATSSMILRLCNMKEEQRLVVGQEVKACPDGMVASLVERLNDMENEQVDFVLDTEGELTSIVREVGIAQEKERIELEAEIEAPAASVEESVAQIKLETVDDEEDPPYDDEEDCGEEDCGGTICKDEISSDEEEVEKITKKEAKNEKQEIEDEEDLTEHTMAIDAGALENDLKRRSELGAENEKKERVWAKSPPCEVCGKVFNRKASLEMHMVTHSNVRDFSCNECVSKFSRKKDLARHKKDVHGHSPVLDCELCDFKSKKVFRLKNHQKNEHGIKLAFACDMCDFTFYKNQHLKRHKFRRHTPKEEKAKQREMEEKDKNRICDRCGKSCPSSRSLREHKNSHSPDYSCKKCGKAFTSTRNLKDHMNIVHERIKKYLCNLCGKSFGRSTNLGDHKTRKHGSAETSLGSSTSPVPVAS